MDVSIPAPTYYTDQWSIGEARKRIADAALVLEGLWYDEGRCFAKWCRKSRRIQRIALDLLRHDLKPHLSRRCKHLKGHGGVKGAVRYLNRVVDHYRYVARFDVLAYYESIDHSLLRIFAAVEHAADVFSVGVYRLSLFSLDLFSLDAFNLDTFILDV